MSHRSILVLTMLSCGCSEPGPPDRVAEVGALDEVEGEREQFPEVEKLVKRITSLDGFHRYQAIGELAQFVRDERAPRRALLPIVPLLIENMSHADPKVRSACVWTLEAIGPGRGKSLQPLIVALKDKHHEVRSGAAQALRLYGPTGQPALAALVESLSDPDARVRQYSAWSLGEIGPLNQQVVPALVKALQDDDKNVRSNAARSLAYCGSAAREAVPALDLLRDTPDPVLQEAVREALQRIVKDSTKPFNVKLATRDPEKLIVALRDADVHVRINAAALLVDVIPESPAAVTALSESLADTNSGVRWNSCRALAEIGPRGRKAVPALTKCLDDSDSDVRLTAATAIWEITQQSDLLLPLLTETLKTGFGDDWFAAASVSRKLGPAAKAVVPVLIPLLEDNKRRDTHRTVIELLGCIGPDAKAAIPALSRIVENPDARYHDEAKDALSRIRPGF